MKRLIAMPLLALTLFVPLTAFADGLIYQLPEDGTSITFDMEGSFERRGETENMTGTFKISSVGKETVDDRPCRWIEFKMTTKRENQERTVRAKALVPDAELTKGRTPIDHVQKAWFQSGDNDPQEITDFTSVRAGPLPAFLCGPLEDVQNKEPVNVKSGLGDLKCEVSTGSTSFEQNSGTQKITFTNYAHKAAPFGLVKSEIHIEMERNGEAVGSVNMTLVAKQAGKDAKPEISNGR